jgi:hypothetical protein
MKLVLPFTKIMQEDQYLINQVKQIGLNFKSVKFTGHHEIPMQDGLLIDINGMTQFYDLFLFCACFDINYAIKLYEDGATLLKFQAGGMYKEEPLKHYMVQEML